MITIIAGDTVYGQLEEMNRFERYTFYRAKAAGSIDLCIELGGLAPFSHAVIELAVLDENSDALLQWLLDKTKVILLAGNLKPFDVVVRDFYTMGITDVITAQGDDALKQVNESLLRDKAKNADAPVLPVPPPMEDIHAESDAGPEPASPPVHPPKIQRDGRAATIAFAGGGPRIGTTTQVFQTAFYLQSLFHKVAVVDLTGQDRISLYDGEEGIAKAGEDDIYTVHRVPFYHGGRHIAGIRWQYDFILFDFGNFSGITDVVSFMEKDVTVITCGYKRQERQYLRPVFEHDSGSFRYLFSFVPEYHRGDVLAAMEDSAPNTMFAGNTPDMWKYCGSDALYAQLSGVSFRAVQAEAPKGLRVFRKKGPA